MFVFGDDAAFPYLSYPLGESSLLLFVTGKNDAPKIGKHRPYNKLYKRNKFRRHKR